MTIIQRFYSDGAWVEGAATDQLDTLVKSYPDVTAIAAMPDLGPGKYGPVGTAMLSADVHPAVIGSDIGCGMGLYQTDLLHRKLRLDRVADRIKILDEPWDGDTSFHVNARCLPESIYDVGLGTIGGGNHFCEFQAIHEIHDAEAATAIGLDTDHVFVLVHTGSRALGFSVFDPIIRTGTLTLTTGSDAAAAYLDGHDHALAWAKLNRDVVAERACEAARTHCVRIADLSHNFMEATADGILHRKGAAPSDRGVIPIPGSRETLSYLVAPVSGAPAAALASVAHGAGRKYDRSSMHGRIEKVKSVREKMSRNPFGGLVVCEDRNLMIEEAGAAYKNIDAVVADLVAFGLVTIVATFRPMITFKTGQSTIGGRDRK